MSNPLASTPDPPYTAVIFSSVRTGEDDEGYGETAEEMERLAAEQPGYLGIESAGRRVGITVSYWKSEEHAVAWKRVSEHVGAQRLGRERWYSSYITRVATVTRAYGFEAASTASDDI